MIPTLIIIGLMAIPFVDKNPKGVGIYCFKARKFAFVIFTIGILAWFGLIIFGCYFRGPSWLLYLPWESWDIHKPVISKARTSCPIYRWAVRDGILRFGDVASNPLCQKLFQGIKPCQVFRHYVLCPEYVWFFREDSFTIYIRHQIYYLYPLVQHMS